ncbi:MAG: lamin tail domain-containing protein [Labilithrix sp.]|nr:lamin tail domain-containing protein [Labilithrix sp.]MBX3220184.1 lamin tail domain-containing protein [Labilithrix sp.]
MRCSLRRVASVAWTPLLSIGLAWGCAQGAVGEVTPDVDPTLPEVDASWAPSPEGPSEKVPPSDDGDPSAPPDDDEETPPTSPPPTAAAPDAGAPDTGPPPSSGAPPKPTQGEVLITEVMYDPSGPEPTTEWIELYNKSSSARLLGGLTIVDGGNRTHVIAAALTIDPGAYVVLARDKTAAIGAKVPAAAIVYEYAKGLASSTGIQLANAATGSVSLRDGASTIAQAAYGGWFSQPGGSSIQLKTLTYPASIQKSNWCLSAGAWTAGSDKGTPGAASDCP